MNAFMVLIFGILSLTLIGGAQHAALDRATQASQADILATQAILFHRAARCHLDANPGYNGPIGWDEAMASDCTAHGLHQPSGLGALVSTDTLYVYSTAPATPAALDQLAQKMNRSPRVARNAHGTLVSVYGTLNGMTAPGNIPNGALVIVGK